jgi:hypothetical protein
MQFRFSRIDSDRILGGTTAYGGVLASIWTDAVRVKRAEISGVSLNAGTNTSADNYALAA